MFRGKESSNRIELSQLVLVFWAACGSGEGAGGWGCLGHGGYHHTCAHACVCMHIYAHACTDMYICIEIANGCPHGSIHVYHVYNMHLHVCMCVHACTCACVHRTPPHTHIHLHANPPTCHPQGESLESVKI